MSAPAVVIMLLVAAYPIGYAVWLSLHEYSLITPGLSRWAEPFGLGNYLSALRSHEVREAARVTFVFTGVSVIAETILGLSMALLMNAAFKGRAVLRTVVLVPWAVLTVVTAIMWRAIYDSELGFVNELAGAVGLRDDTVWLGSEPQALIVLIVADVWKTAPFMALLLLAGLQVIPSELYEAAKVDGASTVQQFRAITVPLLRPALLVALIFRTLDALRVFDLPYVLTSGAFGTDTLSLASFRQLQQNNVLGLGSALAVITFAIVMLVSLIYIAVLGRGWVNEMAPKASRGTPP